MLFILCGSEQMGPSYMYECLIQLKPCSLQLSVELFVLISDTKN